MRSSLAILMTVACFNCAHTIKTAKPAGPVPMSYLSGNSIPLFTKEDLVVEERMGDKVKITKFTRASAMRNHMLRTQLLKNDSFPVAEVKAVPLTVPYVLAAVADDMDRKGYEERWSEAQKQIASKKAITSELEKLKNKSCFVVTLEATNKPKIMNWKSWHADLKQGSKSVPVVFSEGKGGLNSVERTGYVYLGTLHTSYLNNYSYTARGCADQSIDWDKAFVLTMDIRFDAGAKPFDFSWIPQEQMPQ